MSVTSTRRLDAAAAFVGPFAVAALGCAAVSALAGAGMGSVGLTVVGAGVAAAALVYLMSAELVPPLAVLLISLPLPALVVGDGLRLAPAAPLTACVLAAWFLRWGPTRRSVRWGRLPRRSMGLVAGAFALSGALSSHPGAAAREVANLTVLLLLLVVATDLLSRHPERIRTIPVVVSVVAAACGFLAMLEMVDVLPGQFPGASGLNRAALGFGQPNGLGMFLALSTPLTVYAWRSSPRGILRLLGGAAVLAVAGGLLATFSRGSWASVLLGSLVLVLLREKSLALKIWVVALGAVLVVDQLSGGAIREAVLGVGRDSSIPQRLALMAAGAAFFLDHPLVGVGPGGFAEEIERAQVLVPTLWDVQPTPHNAYLQVAAETGLLGLIPVLVLVVVAGVAVVRCRVETWSRRRRCCVGPWRGGSPWRSRKGWWSGPSPTGTGSSSCS